MDQPEEVLYMQVFVEEVGLWMDSMDADKTFSRILPFHALRQPMLKFAFLSCGARHLTLVNSAYPEERALSYYNTATQLLLKSLQNPERDSALCATTAVILNVYEIMSEKALQRMNHIAGARALIKECGWNAKSKGIGGACFWLNVGLEVHSCLHFNWAVAWEPDDWAFDMTMVRDNQPGSQEVWTHKVLYIIAKVANFRSQIPRFQEASAHAEQLRLNQRIQVIKRATIVARLFYHTAMALLGSMHPAASMDPSLASEMHDMKVYHSRMICGIVAHVKDRGVASASIRCLAIAAECLTVRQEQEEVLEMFDKIKKETGWRVDFLRNELMERWGWHNDQMNSQANLAGPNGAMNGTTNGQSAFFQQGTTTMPPIPAQPPPRPKIPAGIVNPMYKEADFSKPHHPYQQYYVAPNNNNLHDTSMFHFGI
ncbi:putative c6 zinc finger domain-containing protein [Phaeomoniella chlamydospora]|uniref:Putative c6 zinc finger domain-containing protein n=1 Tax=Phaeomoniella chlamydospora TaxID=158046 RepID=A0A0G2GF22_PHACM|nr:putative c6 zinc finger domain-containing protein [Phaeomoniella chlamydospora]